MLALFPRKARNLVDCSKSSVERLGCQLVGQEDAVSQGHTQIQHAAGLKAPVARKPHQKLEVWSLQSLRSLSNQHSHPFCYGSVGIQSRSADIKTGWFDVTAAKYSAAVNHYTCLALLKLDVLDTFAKIPVAVAYTTPAGDRLTSVPASSMDLDEFKAEYRDLPGWQCSTKGVRTWSDLPLQAQKYIEFIGTSSHPNYISAWSYTCVCVCHTILSNKSVDRDC